MTISCFARRAVTSVAALLTTACAIATTVPAKNEVAAFIRPDVQHVIVVVLENKNADDARRQPFLARIAREGALLNSYYGVAHPSQPNYVALISGSFSGVPGNGNVTLDRRHIGDTLTGAGVSWKSYAEGYPGGCSLVKTSGRYARKHEPFLSFANVQRNDGGMCEHIVNADRFFEDVKGGTLPRFSLFIPDLDHDAHDQPLAFADQWLSQTFGSLMTEEFRRSTLLIVTFDEDDGHGKPPNHIYAALWGAGVRPGAVSNDVYDHYDLLRTIEAIFSLDPLPTATPARPIGGIWR
ncbi:MAG: alkaline phosphatase family protein [Thermoanaerobaculia bacterium]